MDGFKSLPKMQCFKEGGSVKPKAMCYGGKMKKGGEVDKTDMAQDKAVVKKAFKMHDKQEHEGEHTDLSKLRKGGRAKKEMGTVKKYKAGGSVTNVYEAKKDSGDKDNIRKVKQITPTKANASSAAGKGDNTTAAFKKGGVSKKFADGGLTGKALEDAMILNRLKNARKYLGSDQQAEFMKQGLMNQMPQQAPQKPMATMPDVNQMGDATGNIGYKRGGKIKKCADGGSLKETDAQENPGLAKLPTNVRNKMGYMRTGGKAKKMMTGGTCS